MSSTPTIEALKQALQIKEQIASLEARLSQILEGKSITPSIAPAKAPVKRGPKKMSAEARGKIAAAQKARWAKTKAKAPVKAKPAPKKKGGLTPEGRAKIVAALKARWAARKQASGK